MNALDIVLAVEQGSDDFTEDEIIAGIAEHKDTLRHLQGSWGRLVRSLEERGLV